MPISDLLLRALRKITLQFKFEGRRISAIERKRREEVHYQLLRDITKSLDQKKIDDAFDERFEKWWKKFEPWIVKQLEEADFVKKGRLSLEKWLADLRDHFHSTLRTLFNAQLWGWVFSCATLPLNFDIVDDQFDIEDYVQKANRKMEAENIRVSLDNVFYLPSHATQLVIDIERRTRLVEKCERECKRRGLKTYQIVSRKIKFEIAQAIGMNPGRYSTFKSSRSRVYHRISKILSQLHYHKRGAARQS
jgi:hypothetical protein